MFHELIFPLVLPPSCSSLSFSAAVITFLQGLISFSQPLFSADLRSGLRTRAQELSSYLLIKQLEELVD